MDGKKQNEAQEVHEQTAVAKKGKGEKLRKGMRQIEIMENIVRNIKHEGRFGFTVHTL